MNISVRETSPRAPRDPARGGGAAHAMTRGIKVDIAEYLAQDFGTLDDLFKMRAAERPSRTAVICEDRQISFAELNALVDRAAAALQREGVLPRDMVSICASSSIEYVALFVAILRAGATVAPLPPSATPEQLVTMLRDCRATHLFSDADVSRHLAPVSNVISARRVALGPDAEGEPFERWLAPRGATPTATSIDPDQSFNIIYSSGTTGTPKGIVHSHRMRWVQIIGLLPAGYGPDAVAILATPLYSNTTLASLLPALASGATCVLMPKFDARRYLELCERHGVTVTMLVPVQYRRILEEPSFDDVDLSTFQMKYSTSAPFPAELKREVLTRWPGGLIEIYGMTEGGVICVLFAHEHPDKLHTVGRWFGPSDLKVIDDEGRVLAPGQAGEVVGRSLAMMDGYLNQPVKSAEAEWWSPEGHRYLRTGDIASVDDDGFVTLVGRKKDMIISGGFNIYPIDLEMALIGHPSVEEVAVIGQSSDRWGETPVAFVTLGVDAKVDAETLRRYANDSLGKHQRISEVRIIDALPRSAIGKVLKRELQDRLTSESA
jgi:acyl-CoA synthetase (AMP-forming)/AMP-acid ligase II